MEVSPPLSLDAADDLKRLGFGRLLGGSLTTLGGLGGLVRLLGLDGCGVLVSNLLRSLEKIFAAGAHGRRRFTTHQRDRWIFFVEFCIATALVVLSHHIHRFLDPVVAGIGFVGAQGGRPCGIFLMSDCSEAGPDHWAHDCVAEFLHFITDAPYHHRGVVAISAQ